MALVKYACAVANRDLGKLGGSGKRPLEKDQIAALLDACLDLVAGKLDDQFPIDVFQTGSGTSSNMNINEVIANLAIERLGGDRMGRVAAQGYGQSGVRHQPTGRDHQPRQRLVKAHGHPRPRRR